MSLHHLDLEPTDDFLKKLNQHIIDNISDSAYTLDDLCKDCQLSRSQLHRKIKDEAGLSTSLYVRHIKLLKAKELLRDQSLNVSEIAYASGFKSPQTLSRYFSSTFGETPTQFRSNLAQKENGIVIDTHHKSSAGSEAQDVFNDFDQQLVADGDETVVDNSVGSLPKVEFGTDAQVKKSTHKKRIVAYWLFGLIALLAIAMVIRSIWEANPRNSDEQKSMIQKHDNSIAVLPFIGIGGKETRDFSAGMQEDILTRLAFFDDLKVISRTSTEIFTGSKKTIKEIGAQLGVAYILEGSVRMQDQKVAVTTQLIRANDGFHVWAENYIREVEDVFKIQNEISLDVAKVLNQKINDEKREQIDNTYIPGKKAYREYIIGKELLKERTHSSLMASIEQFDKALAEEPDFVDAVIMKANAYQLLGNIGYDRRDEHIVNSEKYALTALRMDPRNAKAYSILACIYRDAHKWDQAKVAFETALEFAPNDALSNYWYSLMLREVGALEKAVIYSTKAKELDPLYPCLLYTSPSPRDKRQSRMPSSA